MSFAVKAVKSVVGAVGDVVGGVIDGVKKVFKEITSSTIGKVALLAGAVYLGGAAFGYWESPFASINGAFVSSGETMLGSGVATTSEGVLGLSEAGAAEALGGSAAAGTTAELGLTQTAAANALGTGTTVGTATPLAIPTGTFGLSEGAAKTALSSTVNNGGIISNAMKGIGEYAGKAGKWIEANPWQAAMGLNAAASMMSPDKIDLLEEEERLRKERLKEQQRNLLVGDVDLGVRPGSKILYDNQGNQVYAPEGGIIGSRIKRGAV